MNLTVTITGLKELQDHLRDVAEKQIPYAVSQALNETAKEVRRGIITHTRQAFNVRTGWLDSNAVGVGINWATKTNPTVIVENRASFMALQEPGGTKQPHGQVLAIPVPGGPKRTKRDLIAPSARPRVLMRGGKGFIIRTKTGQSLLLVRRGKRRIVAMYFLEPNAKIEPRYGFVEIGMDVARKRIGPNFDVALERALRTAR